MYSANGIFALLRDLWRFTFVFFTTIIHEMGHAVVSLITGGGVRSITLQMTASGETISTFRRTPLGRISSALSLLAGYPMPGIFATYLLIMLNSYSLDLAINIIIATCLVCFLFSLKGRSAVGIFYTILFGVISGVFHYYIQDNNYTYLWIFALAASLYIGSLSSLFDLFKLTILYPENGNDAVFCSERIVALPPLIWVFVLTGLSASSVWLLYISNPFDYWLIVNTAQTIVLNFFAVVN